MIGTGTSEKHRVCSKPAELTPPKQRKSEIDTNTRSRYVPREHLEQKSTRSRLMLPCSHIAAKTHWLTFAISEQNCPVQTIKISVIFTIFQQTTCMFRAISNTKFVNTDHRLNFPQEIHSTLLKNFLICMSVRRKESDQAIAVSGTPLPIFVMFGDLWAFSTGSSPYCGCQNGHHHFHLQTDSVPMSNELRCTAQKIVSHYRQWQDCFLQSILKALHVVRGCSASPLSHMMRDLLVLACG